jgi:hypothetical protein
MVWGMHINIEPMNDFVTLLFCRARALPQSPSSASPPKRLAATHFDRRIEAELNGTQLQSTLTLTMRRPQSQARKEHD